MNQPPAKVGIFPLEGNQEIGNADQAACGSQPITHNTLNLMRAQKAEERMTPISRRYVLAGLAASSAAAIAAVHSEERQSSGANGSAVLSVDERRRHVNALLSYFASIGPQLLRSPDGLLKHPSIAQ